MNSNKKNKILYKIQTALKFSLKDIPQLSEEQVTYINYSKSQSTFLEACPGSGKTEVIGLKAAYVISRWESKPGGLAVLTFTVSAAKELNDRVRKYSNVGAGLYPHFIGTFDSWLHSYILQPFFHYLTKYPGINGDKSVRIIEQNSEALFLFGFRVIIGSGRNTLPINATEYHFNADWSEIIPDSENMAAAKARGLSNNDVRQLRDNKIKFLKAGFATYADAEVLCLAILDKWPSLQEKLAQRFPEIIIDECQDLSEGQISLLEILRNNGTTLHFVGDLNQSIYEFRKVDPNYTLGYINSKNFYKLKLTNNYRSCQEIVDVCSNILGNATPIKANTTSTFVPSCRIMEYTPHTYTDLPQSFENIVRTQGIDVKKCAILARGKSTLKPFKSQNKTPKLSKVELIASSLTFYYKPNRTTEDLQSSIRNLGKALCFLAYSGNGDARNEYCPRDHYEVVEWRILLREILKKAVVLFPFTHNGVDQTWTQWVARLKPFLSHHWALLVNHSTDYANAARTLRAPSGRAANSVSDLDITTGVHNVFRTTTIHSVKGETLDAVMLISNPTKHSQGGHYSHWLREGNFDEEHIRFAYVACSRPKYLLIIATPPLSAVDKAKLQALGFV